MKKNVSLVLALLTLCTLAACGPKQQEVTLATTTSVYDSGLLDYLIPELKKDTGITLHVISQGSGQAIKTGEAGDADVLLVHSKAAEEKFVEEGYGIERLTFMYNFFVIVGPSGDPAGIKGAASASDAFKKIYEGGHKFISRGDESGTHTKESSIWKAAGIEPSGDGYISAGKGMGDTLRMAGEMQGYTLTDKATFLSIKAELDLDMLLGEGPDLRNDYSIIQCNPQKNPGINADGAKTFKDWMLGDKALGLIAQYGADQYGEPLFFVAEK